MYGRNETLFGFCETDMQRDQTARNVSESEVRKSIERKDLTT